VNSFLATVGFLTIIPIPRRIHEDRDALRGAVGWFPVVGAILGALLAGLDSLYEVFPPAVRAALTVLSWVALTRGLHTDGLADSADGLLSFRPREKILEIMREPRTGPMGVVALIGILGLKTALVFSLAGNVRGAILFSAVLAGRCAMGVIMGTFPYAREQGLGSAMQGKSWPKVFWCALCAIIAATLLLAAPGWIAAVTSLVLAMLFGAWVRRQIGGYTGDTLGAACELTETLWLLIFTAVV
jgi:adenosylcobinamide-GDP ribazoletransferase